MIYGPAWNMVFATFGCEKSKASPMPSGLGVASSGLVPRISEMHNTTSIHTKNATAKQSGGLRNETPRGPGVEFP